MPVKAKDRVLLKTSVQHQGVGPGLEVEIDLWTPACRASELIPPSSSQDHPRQGRGNDDSHLCT